MATNQENNLIEITISHFQPYYDEIITVDDAQEMVNNFTGFARLLLKLEGKKKVIQQQKKEFNNDKQKTEVSAIPRNRRNN